MNDKQNEKRIRQYAKALDDAIEKKNIEEIVSCFSEDCEIELLGIKLAGKEGLRKAIGWMYRYLKEIVFVPVTIMVEGNTFFEEFIVKAKIKGGKQIQIKQAEVLIYDGSKVMSLHLYFDRLELAEAFASNIIEKIMIKQMVKTSLKGMV